jgi:hypothetical protein
MKKLKVIHWKPEEIKDEILKLNKSGYDVDSSLISDMKDIRMIRDNPPDALLIDLSRLPSQGRDIAIRLKTYKSFRHLPIVFIGGDPEKVTRIREKLTDAIYTTWGEIEKALRFAIENPPTDPVIPESSFAGYSGASLQKKLGIKEKQKVCFMNAPEGFIEILGDLPGNVTIQNRLMKESGLIIWFCQNQKEMEKKLTKVINQMSDKTGLWIAWKKQKSGEISDLNQQTVRKTGLNAGLVDFKICSIDDTWSGLQFVKRKKTAEK